jgi:carbon-monoxide dehydrogenase large subunit
VKAQIKGGMIQSVSFTLLEAMLFENGVPLSVNFMDYPIATTADMPQQLHPIVVEVPQQSGPYGARDLSHHVQVGAAPAIANAIYRAVGVRIRDLPITPQRIYDAIQKKRNAEDHNS